MHIFVANFCKLQLVYIKVTILNCFKQETKVCNKNMRILETMKPKAVSSKKLYLAYVNNWHSLK